MPAKSWISADIYRNTQNRLKWSEIFSKWNRNTLDKIPGVATAWNTGLVARDNAPRLLHRSVGGQGRGIRRSLSSIRSQYNSAVTIAMDRYSDSILDRDTTSCFFALQEIKQGPRKTAKPVVDLSSTSPAQLESHNAFRIKNPCQSRDHDEVSLWDILTLTWLLTNEQ